MIPEDVIAEIKRRADIGAVIGRTVKLKKSGRNLVGLCPFHTEKTPSFHVRPDEGFFYCFGCRAAGDVVEFLVRSTGRGFLDVITELAAETGVVLPQEQSSAEESALQKQKKRLLRVCELAHVFFRTRLQSDEGRAARAYLKDIRKLDDQGVDDFGLGFGGQGDVGLRDFLVSQGISVDDGVAAGVLGRGERGAYDFFRHRITIPIRDARGDIVSFGGRIFGAAAEPWTAPDGRHRAPPKYLNGPQSPVYDKSAVLYGLFQAQPGLKQGKPAVLVEGYFDVIAVRRAGLPTAVAPCGTSLTPRHVEDLKKRLGDQGRVIVCLDADKAGQEAAARAILMFLAHDVDVGLVVLPDKDPDQMAQAGRLDELRGLLLGAPAALDHLVRRAQEKATGSVQARVAAIDGLLPFLAAPARELVRKEAVRLAAKAFGEDVAVLEREVDDRGRRLLGARLRGEKPKPRASASSSSPSSRGGGGASTRRGSSPGATSAREPRRRAGRSVAPLNDTEVQLAKIVLCHPELAPRVALLDEHVQSAELKGFVARLVDALVRFHDLPPREVLPKVPVLPGGHIAALADRVRLDGPDRVLGLSTALSMVDAISRDLLERASLEARLGALQPQISAADERGDHEERKRLLSQQKAIVATLQAFSAPAARAPLVAPLARVVGGLPAPGAPPGAAGPTLPSPPSPPPPPPVAPEEPPWSDDPEDDPWAA